jgi:hypothetical protein
MATDWQLIRDVLNGVINACEAIDRQRPDLESQEYEARSAYQADVSVGDFLNRLWRYPEGAARDIIRIRSRLGADQKYPQEVARALVNAAVACAETIGLGDGMVDRELPDFQPHCGSGGRSIRSILTGIPKIQNGWMLTGITRALAEHRAGRQAAS